MKVTLVPAQIVVADAATETEGVTVGVMVIVMLLLASVIGEAHPKLLVKTHEITSPVASVLVV